MSVDPSRLRAVLGHYPTGVALVCALGEDGGPIGMIVGSFTSVSLDPPLVAFLPSRSSYTYGLLRRSRHFTVNVLAARQEQLCRRFATPGAATDKWEGIAWTPAPSGSPIIDGCVAWIDCSVDQVVPAGDHDIVLGLVHDLAVCSAELPLLFFQGGFGRFAPDSLVVTNDGGIAMGVHAAELGRAAMTRVASRIGSEVLAQTSTSRDLVVVASSGSVKPGMSPHQIGTRLPFVPPLGACFVAWGPEELTDEWLARSPMPLSDEDDGLLRDGLRRVRERGVSVALLSDEDDEIRQAVARYTLGNTSARREREMVTLLAGLRGAYEPESWDLPAGQRLRLISAPVFGPDGSVPMVVQVRELPPGLSAQQIHRIADELIAGADAISRALALPD